MTPQIAALKSLVGMLSDSKSKLRLIISIFTTISGFYYFSKTFLLPFIAQRLLNLASLKVIRGSILKPSDSAFKLLLLVEMRNSGPLKTLIRYRKPLSLARFVVAQNNKNLVLQNIAQVLMKGATRVPSWGGQAEMDSVVTVSYDNLDDFSSFSKDLVSQKGDVKQVLYGDGLSIELFGGLVQIDGLSIYKEVSLQGMGGLKQVVLNGAKVVGSTPEYLILDCDTTIFNPSNVSLEKLGDVYCTIHYVDSEQFPDIADMSTFAPHATILLENLTLKHGANRFITRAHFKVSSNPGIERASALKLLSNFICCKPTGPILIRGHPRKATSIPYLFKSLTSLSITSSMPGLPQDMKMIKSALLLLHSPLSTLVSLQAPTKLHLLNAFPVPIHILQLKGRIMHNGNEIATLDVDVEKSPITLDPLQSTWTREIKLKLKLAVSAIKALFDFDKSEGTLLVDVDSVLDCRVGEYLVQGVRYTQNDVVSRLGLA